MNPNSADWVRKTILKWERRADLATIASGPPPEGIVLTDKDYLREPVAVRTFIFDDRYLGMKMRGRVFSRIVDDIEELFAGDYSEVVLGGSIGWGKTRFMEIAVAYDLYLLSCLKDPAAAYGMIPGSNLMFVNVSVNLKQAYMAFFTDLYNIIKDSPYFQTVFPYDRKLKSEIAFPRNVHCYPIAASEQAALGFGVFCASIDEANFMELVEHSKRKAPGDGRLYDQAEAVINKLKQRIRSRMDQRGKLPGHIYVSSSARYPGDITERMEQQAREQAAQGQHHMFVRHYAHWDTHPPDRYLTRTFKVEVGDLTRRSRVLDGTEENVNLNRVIEVPLNFKREFECAPDACVRDYAGISTVSINPFMVKREMIRQMFDMGARAGLKHPFSKLEVTLQQKVSDCERLLSKHLHWVEQQKKDEQGRPMFQDGEPVLERVLNTQLRHAHVDLSKNKDATGLCIAHVVGTKNCTRLSYDDGKYTEVQEEKPIIAVELALRVVAPPLGEIDIPRVRGIFYQLAQLGMEFGSVTFDTYGSQESIKSMKEQGFRADEFSVDRTREAYEALKEAIYDGRVLCYEFPVLERELAQLEDTGNKIDHPSAPGSSKDIADCLAAVVHHCEEGWRRGEMVGGLFKIGMVERPGELTEEVQAEIMAARSHVVQGQRLEGKDEDTLLFSAYVADLLVPDKVRFGRGEKGGSGGTI